MNKRVQIILLSAFLVAATCTFAVYKLAANRIIGSQAKTRTVVIAAEDLKVGSVLKASDLGTTKIEGPLPEGAITDVQQALGRGVVSDLYKGEPIVTSRLAAPGAGGGLAAIIPPGMRACAVRVDEVVGVAGFVTPGMRVDVLISGTPPGGNDAEAGPQVKTLLQNIEVLSAGTDIQQDAEGKPHAAQVVNLLVTPEQAEQLSLASSETHIQLVLRNPLDNQVAQTSGTAVSNLYGAGGKPVAERPAPPIAPQSAPAKPQTQVYVIQVYNGSKQSEQKFASSEGGQ